MYMGLNKLADVMLILNTLSGRFVLISWPDMWLIITTFSIVEFEFSITSDKELLVLWINLNVFFIE
jgi:hypothetical protein